MAKEETIVLVGLLSIFLLFSAWNDSLIDAPEPSGSAITDSLNLPFGNTTIIIGMVGAVIVILFLIILIMKTKKKHSNLVAKKKRFIPSLEDEKDQDKKEKKIDDLFSQDLEKYVGKGGASLNGEIKLGGKPGEAKPKEEVLTPVVAKPVSKVNPQLLAYIKKAQESKLQKQQIIVALMKTGWKQPDIQAAFDKLHQDRLDGFIKFALKHHQHEDQIVAQLVKTGWNKEEVTKVMADIKQKMAFSN